MKRYLSLPERFVMPSNPSPVNTKTASDASRLAAAGISSVILLIGLAGCAAAPAEHASLQQSVTRLAPAAWNTPPGVSPSAAIAATTASAEPVARQTADSDSSLSRLNPQAWWAQFEDPTLRRLIQLVLSDNLDLRAALERVTQAQTQVARRAAELSPRLDATAVAADARQITPPPLGYVREAGAGVTASWTPDVFGGQRLAVLAAKALLSGRREELDQVRLALAAQTASAYIELRAAQSEQQILQDNAQIRSDTLRLTQRRLQFGLASSLDVARAANQLAELQSRMPAVDADIAQQLRRLAVFTGQQPETIDATLVIPGAIPMPPPGVPEVLPSQALLGRPDVTAAYTRVLARAAQTGAARAERYPQFSLRLSDGLLAASWVGLPTLTDNLFSAALNATSPIFDAGRIRADIEGRESQLREAELGLDQTLLVAMQEVEDSRSDLVSAARQQQALVSALDQANQALQLSNRLYKGGAASFLDVLSAQEAYLKNADELNQARRAHAMAAIAVYRALGGGWNTTIG